MNYGRTIFGASLLAFSALPRFAAAQDPAESGKQQPAPIIISDVVVTARRVSESLQETPVAVTAVTGQELVNRSVTSFRDLAMQTPSLRITQMSTSATSNTIALRGQVYTDLRLSADPAVAMYVDGVYIPRAVGVDAGQLFDIERVEILRGPQGTLFGRNSTGGAINIFTKNPSQFLEGEVRARVGSYGERSLSGVLNVPLGDQLAARFVANHYERDGFGTNLFDGGDLGSRDSDSFRFALQWDASSNVKVTLRGDALEAEGTQSAFRPALVVPGSPAVNRVVTETNLSPADALSLYQSYVTAGDFQDATLNQSPFDRISARGVSLTAEVDFDNGISLSTITAFRNFDRESATDFDGSPFTINQDPLYETHDEQISQEFQLNGSAFSGRFDWITGLYYADESGWEGGSRVSFGGAPSITYGDLESRTLGVYAQGTYDLTDAFSATLGVRQTWDERDLISGNRTATTCTSLGAPLATLGELPCIRVLPTYKSDKLSYTFSLQYQATDDLLAYFRTSRGYRSGGQNLTGGSGASLAAATTTFTPFEPEFVTDYEIGVKSDWFDNRLRANLAVYFSDYSEVQRSNFATVPGTTPPVLVSAVQNAAEAEIKGIELEVSAILLEGLEAHATYTHIDPRYTEYEVGGVDRTGDPWYFVSKNSYSASLSYTRLVSLGEWRSQFDYQYDTRMPTSGNIGARPAVGLLNGRTSITIDSLDLDLAVFGTNLTDKEYYQHQTDFTSVNFGWLLGIAGAPRTLGVELTKRF